MLIGIIKNLDNTYEYLYNNSEELVSYHVSKNGFELSDKMYVKSILSKFKKSDSAEYLTKFREYDVYYDNNTMFKHFLLNGQEDYKMFFKYNGKDALLYSKEDKDEFDSFFKTFVIAGLTIALSITGFVFIAKTNINVNTNVSAYTAHSISDVLSLKKYEPIDYNEAINSINSSNFTEEVKKTVANEDFLKLIFSYYKGSALEYTARLKFEDLRMEYFGSEIPNSESMSGFYNSSKPNIINISDKQGLDKTHDAVHEFIHLLQAEGTNYYYLNEGVAELMSSELLETQPHTYISVVNNLKLLINIVGPEAIYELSFGGDDNKLNEILNTYLSTKEVVTLKHHLATGGLSAGEGAEVHNEIEKILYKLYENMYGHDIAENKDIMSCITSADADFGIMSSISDSRKFLIPTKMNDQENIKLTNINNIVLAKNGIVDKKICYKESYKVETPTPEMILNTTDYELVENYNNDKFIKGKVIREESKMYYIHFHSPIKAENYNESAMLYISSKVYTIQEAIEKGFVSLYKVTYSNEKTNDNQKEHVYYESTNDNINLSENECNITVNGIKARFSDQYDNLLNRINSESYHK